MIYFITARLKCKYELLFVLCTSPSDNFCRISCNGGIVCRFGIFRGLSENVHCSILVSSNSYVILEVCCCERRCLDHSRHGRFVFTKLTDQLRIFSLYLTTAQGDIPNTRRPAIHFSQCRRSQGCTTDQCALAVAPSGNKFNL